MWQEEVPTQSTVVPAGNKKRAASSPVETSGKKKSERDVSEQWNTVVCISIGEKAQEGRRQKRGSRASSSNNIVELSLIHI